MVQIPASWIPRNPRSPTDIALDRHLSPVNKTAARVVQPGVHWRMEKRSSAADSPNPLPTYPAGQWKGMPDLTGLRVGALKVLGYGGDKRWVVRCVCGIYTKRTAKALKNPGNADDCCERCRQKQYLTRKQQWIAGGRKQEPQP